MKLNNLTLGFILFTVGLYQQLVSPVNVQVRKRALPVSVDPANAQAEIEKWSGSGLSSISASARAAQLSLLNLSKGQNYTQLIDYFMELKTDFIDKGDFMGLALNSNLSVRFTLITYNNLPATAKS